MDMGYVYGFIVIMSIVAFFMSPPEFIADRITRLTQTHPILDEAGGTKVNVNGSVVDTKQAQQFIRAFNRANFLLSHGRFHPRLDNKHVLRVTVQEAKNEHNFVMFFEGRHIEIVRYKSMRRPPIVYRVESRELNAALTGFAS